MIHNKFVILILLLLIAVIAALAKDYDVLIDSFDTQLMSDMSEFLPPASAPSPATYVDPKAELNPARIIPDKQITVACPKVMNPRVEINIPGMDTVVVGTDSKLALNEKQTECQLTILEKDVPLDEWMITKSGTGIFPKVLNGKDKRCPLGFVLDPRANQCRYPIMNGRWANPLGQEWELVGGKGGSHTGIFLPAMYYPSSSLTA